MTDEQRVKEVWPDAWERYSDVFDEWTIYQLPFTASIVLGRGATRGLAFADAASRLSKTRSAFHEDNCGRTGKCIHPSCKLDCACWCHKLAKEPAPQMERWGVHYDSMPHTCLDSEHCDCNCEGCLKARGFKVKVLNGLCVCGHVDCPHCSRRIAARVMQKSPESLAPQTFEEWWAETGKLWNLVHDERLRLAAKDTARRPWNAAKASSPAVTSTTPSKGRLTVPRYIAHVLWCEGGRLRTELAASLGMHPENWHKEGLQQRIAEWDKAAERYFDYALSGAASSPAITGGESEPTLLGRSKEEWKNHIDQLFEIATQGEDIPVAVILYGWPGSPTKEDKEWASSLIKDVRGKE